MWTPGIKTPVIPHPCRAASIVSRRCSARGEGGCIVMPQASDAADVPEEQPAANDPEDQVEQPLASDADELPASSPVKLMSRAPTVLIPKHRRKRYPVGRAADHNLARRISGDR